MPVAQPPATGGGWGAPAGPPTAPPYAPMPAATGGAPGAAPAEPKKKSRTGLVIGLVVVGLLVIGGIVAAVAALGGGSDATLTVDTCEIGSDGELSATGTIRDASGDRVRIDVEFTDVATDDDVDSQELSVELDGGRGSWTASGTAGDAVNQVTCEATLEN